MPPRSTRFGATAARNGWFDPSHGPLSAVLLDGGCLYVPDAEYAQLLALFAECVFHDGERVYLVERPSAHLRFYADMDVCLAPEVDPDDFEARMVDAFCARCAELPELRQSHVVVLAAARRRTPEGGHKLGVHLVLPQTRVSVNEAEALRAAIVAKGLGPHAPLNTWEDAFDASVYRQGGLRMVGARKMAPCGCTAGACPHRARKVDAGRPYVLRGVRGPEGEKWESKLRANPVLLVRVCSIRAPGGESAPPPPAKRKRIAPSGSSTTSRTDGVIFWPDVVVGEVHAQHRHVVVSATSETTSSSSCYLTLDGDGARFCPNVDRAHRQSTLYAIVDRHTGRVCLRCRCKKDTCPRFCTYLHLSKRGAALFGASGEAQRRGLPLGFA